MSDEINDISESESDDRSIVFEPFLKKQMKRRINRPNKRSNVRLGRPTGHIKYAQWIKNYDKYMLHLNLYGKRCRDLHVWFFDQKKRVRLNMGFVHYPELVSKWEALLRHPIMLKTSTNLNPCENYEYMQKLDKSWFETHTFLLRFIKACGRMPPFLPIYLRYHNWWYDNKRRFDNDNMPLSRYAKWKELVDAHALMMRNNYAC